MKWTLLMLFFLIATSGSAQQEVNLWFEDGCTGRILKMPYTIRLNDVEIAHDDTVKCIVPEAGIYSVSATLHTKTYNSYYNFNIKVNGITNDTIYLYKIAPANDGKTVSRDTVFKFCNRVCNGRERDYDLRNHKRAEGVFVNGWPRRRLKYYNEKGELIRIETYKKKQLREIWDK